MQMIGDRSVDLNGLIDELVASDYFNSGAAPNKRRQYSLQVDFNLMLEFEPQAVSDVENLIGQGPRQAQIICLVYDVQSTESLNFLLAAYKKITYDFVDFHDKPFLLVGFKPFGPGVIEQVG